MNKTAKKMKKWYFCKYDVNGGDWGGFISWYQGDNELFELLFSALQGITYAIILFGLIALLFFGLRGLL